MTGRRLKLIAAQAVVVGALMIVVSLTLLRPEDGNPLFDIVAPGPADVSVGTADSWQAYRDSPADRRPQRPGGAASPARPGSDTPPLGLVPAPPATRQDPVEPGDDGEDPTDAQYRDTLSRLTQQVR